jgi:hypothetical protein
VAQGKSRIEKKRNETSEDKTGASRVHPERVLFAEAFVSFTACAVAELRRCRDGAGKRSDKKRETEGRPIERSRTNTSRTPEEVVTVFPSQIKANRNDRGTQKSYGRMLAFTMNRGSGGGGGGGSHHHHHGATPAHPLPTTTTTSTTWTKPKRTKSRTLVLDPDAVRRRALSIPGCRPVTTSVTAAKDNDDDNSDHVVSFLVMRGDDKNGHDPARVTVFADTGTVCVSRAVAWSRSAAAGLDDENDGGTGGSYQQPPPQIRHVFRRHVTELDAVERLLRNPPPLTPVDRTIVGLLDRDGTDEGAEVEEEEDDNAEVNKTSTSFSACAAGKVVKDPIGVLRSEMELAQVGVAILEGEKSKLEHHLHGLREERGRALAESKAAPGAPAGAAPVMAATTAAAAAATALPAMTTVAPRTAAPADSVPSRSAGVPAPPSSQFWNRTPKQAPTPQTSSGAKSNNKPSQASASSLTTASAPALVPIMTKDIGMEFQFSLSAASMKHVDQCMSDITRMNKLIRGVATNGRGTVFLYGNGGVAYTPSIPRPLHHKLSQLRSNTKMSSRPSYVALGSKDRFYCAFHDGTYSVKGPKSLEKELKRCFAPPQMPGGGGGSTGSPLNPPSLPAPPPPPPVSVAFGGTWEAWFVVFADGSWKFQGKIPSDLSDKLASRKDRGDLVRVTLGPAGEWFVKARNGRMWWGGLTDAADSAIQQLLVNHELCFLDFGEDGSYFVSYD